MPLKLMYITNNAEVALIAEKAGVDRIFVDMEYIGKDLRQGGMDTVQSRHTAEDVKKLSKVLTKSELLVRVNPIHEATKDYSSSKEEIDSVVNAGANIIMLPYFKGAHEVKEFVRLVGGRAKTMLLVETVSAKENIDEILAVDGIDEIYIGLNDLSLGYKMKFMFGLLANGTVDNLVEKFKKKGIPYGFGGLASLDGGLLPGKMVLKEHYRLGSTRVILSRSFCNTTVITDLEEVNEIFEKGVKAIREEEEKCAVANDYLENKEQVKQAVERIVGKI